MQGEGGEQGDPLMLLLFSLGQHSALLAVNAKLKEGESLFVAILAQAILAQAISLKWHVAHARCRRVLVCGLSTGLRV